MKSQFFKLQISQYCWLKSHFLTSLKFEALPAAIKNRDTDSGVIDGDAVKMGHLIIGQGFVHTAVLIYGIIIATVSHTNSPARWQGFIKFMGNISKSSPMMVVCFFNPLATAEQKHCKKWVN